MKMLNSICSLAIIFILSSTTLVLFSCQPEPYTHELRARAQPTVPEGWIEQPFIENAPDPVLTEAEKERGFILFSRPAIEPVYKNTNPLPHERLEPIKAFATPGEFEPLTLSIYPSKDLENLRVTVSDLESGQNKIERSNLDVRLVTYWNMHYPFWSTKGTYRNVPELLEKVTVNDVENDQSQRYWINVHVPEDAKPGIYKGQVSITYDGLNETISVPINFRVLDFKLLKDPNKHYTAYFSGPERQYQGMTGKLYETAVNNDLQAMLDYGFDMVPTVNLDGDGDHVILSEKQKQLMEKMLEKGFTGPIPLYSGSTIRSIIEKHEGIEYKNHWKIDKLPSERFYSIVTNAFTEFREVWERNSWPEFYLCPIDEVDATAREFGVKVYQAIKEAGIKTYITKSSTNKDAVDYSEFVDAWCSQPFDVSYDKAVAGDFQYWSYPNHNAGERKDRPIMLKGGRMTYGFGYWRSGFTVLIPWHWRWITSDDQFEYIRPSSSPCGMRMDEEGNIIPAIYWESFREGYDDLRFIYTLEQTIEERRGSDECAELINESEKFLQDLWKSIKVQQKYLKSDMWPSVEFNMIRWKMAGYISALLKYPSVTSVTAPSVLESIEKLPTDVKYDEEIRVDEMIKSGQLEILDLGENGFSRWHNETKEGSTLISNGGGKDNTPTLKYSIKVDHMKDGANEEGEHPVGWPNVSIRFDKGEIDFSSYDYLYFLVNVNSSRDEAATNATLISINFRTYDDAIRTSISRDLGDIQGQWIPVTVPIPELLRSSFYDQKLWKDLKHINMGISERLYKHGTEITFNFNKVYLLKYKEPLIKEIVTPRYANISQKWIPVNLNGLGFEGAKEKGYKIRLTLNDRYGKNLVSTEVPFQNASSIIMDISKIEKPGLFQMRVEILNKNGEKVDGMNREIQIVSGYL